MWYYNGFDCQRWVPTPAGALATSAARSLPGVRVYPVPAPAGSFTVEMPVGAPATIEVLTAQGQLMYRQQAGANQTQLAVAAALGPGLYLVRVSRTDGSSTEKLFVS